MRPRHFSSPAPRMQPLNPHGSHVAPVHLSAPISAVLPEVLIGLAAGFLAICFLRAASLRWSWALLSLPLALPIWWIAWQPGLAVAITCALAAGAGAYWHLEDTYRGGEEARRVRDALGPFEFARGRLAERRAGDERADSRGLALGVTPAGRICRIPFGSEQGVHGLVLGATGSGKTVTQAAIGAAYLDAGFGAIVIDPKGDHYLRATMRDRALEAGVAFREWSPAGPCIYNPFARGGPTEVTDKALAGHRWSEPHYELATQRLLGLVTTTMHAAGKWPPSLSTLVHYMDPDRLDALAAGVGGGLATTVASYVEGLSARGRADLGGGRDRLAVLAESELGRWLDPALGQGPQLDLMASLRRGEVVYFHLDSDRYPAASRLLAAALVIDLVTLTADMQGGEVRGLAIIDEFAALAAEHVHRLFGRARSAGLSVLLGTQSLADLRSARPDDPGDSLTEQVLTNVVYLIAHREADPDSAERLARVVGTEPSWTTTTKVGGKREGWWSRAEGSRTPDRQFVVPPDHFKRLSPGCAVVIQPTAKRPGELVRVSAPQPRQERGLR